jgi:medium-chain acyl-[acyl-carrier-protein] hydrolase
LISYEVYKLLKENNLCLPKKMFLFSSPAPDFIRDHKFYENFSIKEIKEELASLGGTPKEILENDELMDFLFPIIKNDLIALRDYFKAPIGKNVIDCIITIVTEDLPYAVSWKEFTKKTCDFITVDGSHFFLFDEPNPEKYINVLNKSF